MNESTNEALLTYLRRQLGELPARIDAYVLDMPTRQPLPTRDVFDRLRAFTDEFARGNDAYRWLILSGLRGVGKTTLLMQLLQAVPATPGRKIYLSVDELVGQLGVSLQETIQAFEQILGESLTGHGQPVYLFLDEVQADAHWAITLKSLYDRSRKVMIVVTGSAALSLQMNPDVSRRAIFQTIYPLSFSEFARLHYAAVWDTNLSVRLQRSLLQFNCLSETYERWQEAEGEIQRFLATFPSQLASGQYLQTGTLPSLLRVQNTTVAYEQVQKTVETIINKDVAALKMFDLSTLQLFSRLIYVLAGTDVTSLETLSSNLHLGSHNTLRSMLDVLVVTGLLNRVWPYGPAGKQVRKASKYLFAAPVFRQMYTVMLGSRMTPESLRGKLHEDTVVMTLTRILAGRTHAYSLTYDPVRRGADFILTIEETSHRLLLEVGAGAKDFGQLEVTGKRLDGDFTGAITISRAPLRLSDDGQMMNLPWEYFLLL